MNKNLNFGKITIRPTFLDLLKSFFVTFVAMFFIFEFNIIWIFFLIDMKNIYWNIILTSSIFLIDVIFVVFFRKDFKYKLNLMKAKIKIEWDSIHFLWFRQIRYWLKPKVVRITDIKNAELRTTTLNNFVDNDPFTFRFRTSNHIHSLYINNVKIISIWRDAYWYWQAIKLLNKLKEIQPEIIINS